MPAGDLGLHALALLVYPGALLVLATGLAGEVVAGLALDRSSVRVAPVAPVDRLRRTAASSPALLLGVGLLCALAASQLGIPLSPVSPLERSILVAAIALAAAIWLGWSHGWAAAGSRLTLLAQVCWLVALLAPAMLSQSLRPAALGAVAVPAELPLKVAAGLLALLCLPALLQVLPGTSPGEETMGVRPFLWLPLCGLFASLFFPPGADDLGGVARFLGIALAAGAAAIGMAAAAQRLGPAARTLYPRLLVPVALAVLAIAAVTSVST